jgi:hypothetical protein
MEERDNPMLNIIRYEALRGILTGITAAFQLIPPSGVLTAQTLYQLEIGMVIPLNQGTLSTTTMELTARKTVSRYAVKSCDSSLGSVVTAYNL